MEAVFPFHTYILQVVMMMSSSVTMADVFFFPFSAIKLIAVVTTVMKSTVVSFIDSYSTKINMK